MSVNIEFPNINEGVKLPFRWYNSKQKWNHLRKLCLNECMYKLITPNNTLLPFQVYFKNAVPPFTITWSIYTVNEDWVMNLDPQYLKIIKVGNYYYFIYNGSYMEGRGELQCGYYYSQITITDSAAQTVTWYSEIFYVDLKANLFYETPELEGQIQCLPVLQWYNECGMVGEIYYGSTGFSNLLYLDSDAVITEIEPKIVQEGFEDGNKEFTATWKKRVTQYKLDIDLLPPYMIEALGEMLLHDVIKIHLPFGQGSATLNNVSMKVEHEPNGNGCYALASLTFEMDDITVVDKCCTDAGIDENPCLDSDIVPQLTMTQSGCATLQQASWTPSSGLFCNDGTNNSDIEVVYQNCFFPSRHYVIRITVANYVSGDVTVFFNNVQLGIINANGTYDYYIGGLSGSKTLKITPNAFNGCVGFTLYNALQGYNTAGGWTFNGTGFCNISGQTSNLEIIGSVQVGKRYRYTITVQITNGSLTLNFGGNIHTFTQSGTYTFENTATSGDVIVSHSGAEANVCFDVITVCLIQ
jgi:hypothetical protein